MLGGFLLGYTALGSNFVFLKSECSVQAFLLPLKAGIHMFTD